MRLLQVIAIGFLLSLSAALNAAGPQPSSPQAQLCANGQNELCSTLPAYIGSDPGLASVVGYRGLQGAVDTQTPFDNMSWQSFIALNWQAGAENRPAAEGLSASGQRVWQKWAKVADIFGPGPVKASCANPDNLPEMAIASDGKGTASARNDEYFQASTNLPLIDVNGNWTLFERRLNLTEIKYLAAPDGNVLDTLVTIAGQKNFVAHKKKVYFPPSAPPSATSQTGSNGAMEIKASWRILGANDNAATYFTMKALVTVPGDLVTGNSQICAPVTLGLVGMHIIQKNPVYTANAALQDKWIWSTFEHVNNAPMAAAPCDPVTPVNCTAFLGQASCGAAAPVTSNMSYYLAEGPTGTNVAPVASATAPLFAWNASQPYAGGYATKTGSGYAGPQVTRCWQIYGNTALLNGQWKQALSGINSVFANYMLVGTQWGAALDGTPGPVPLNAVPQLLSNTTLETYIQNYPKSTNNGGPGSCVSCHQQFATLADGKTPSDLSFLPSLASPLAARNVKPGPAK